jgi:hypothetical protein
MDFTFATEAAPGRPNEDYLVLSPDFAILLDGVTELPGLDSGCIHGVRWFVRTLGHHIAQGLSADESVGLDRTLGDAIDAVRNRHATTCDLTNPNSPSSTVAMIRGRGVHIDYLVLCDSTLVFEGPAGVTAVSDDRTAQLPAYDRESVAKLRNRPGGFWVASTAPEAAGEAVSGSVRADNVHRLLLCTDGTTRLVDYFGWRWEDVFELIEKHGTRSAIEAVRSCERLRPDHLRHRERVIKPHDDATLVLRL